MNFKALSQIREQSQTLNTKRHQASGDHHQKGLQAFARALASEFRDKQALREAFDCWLEAIRTHRSNPEPCIGVGYLFMIHGDPRNALKYFQQALRLQPGHPDALLFIETIQNQSHQASKASSGGDADAQHDQVETLIYMLLQKIKAPPPPSPELGTRAALKKSQLDLSQSLQEIQALLQPLEQEMDLGPLRQKVSLLETALRRIETHLQISERFVELSNQMQAGGTQAETLRKQLPELPSGLAQSELENLLDLCDLMADHLEGLEAKGYSIDPVKPDYDQLVTKVNALQDALDELG